MNNGVIANIESARRFVKDSDSTRIAVVVSGSSADKYAWQNRMEEAATRIFNSDGSSLVISLQEQIGEKTREGNFLGTLLAYRSLQNISRERGVGYRDKVALIGMLFGRGERMSPITQAKGCRKPGIEVSPAMPEGRAFTAIEEALLYFTPVARYLERRGFRGILDKWGDETEIPSVDLSLDPAGNEDMTRHDIIKTVSVLSMTPELARQKDWVVFDGDDNMLVQVSRSGMTDLLERLRELGESLRPDGKYYAGISLGPVAVSYDVLDIAAEIFSDEVSREGIYFDFDPYFLMALTLGEKGRDIWYKSTRDDKGFRALEAMVPDFFDKTLRIKEVFREKYGRELNIKTLDLGKDVYWADIGQHRSMRRKFLALNESGDNGEIARRLVGIKGVRDDRGNIIINSCVGRARITDSVIINSSIRDGDVNASVVIDSEFDRLKANGAFAVRSVRTGSTELADRSGLYESLGTADLTLTEGMRHVSLLTVYGREDMKVTEDLDLKDKKNNYNLPVMGNSISFAEAYDIMLGTSMEELERRRTVAVERINNMKGKSEKFKALKFGTSGLRDLVTAMTDMECYINARGFIRFLKERGEAGDGSSIALGGDRRSSTPRIMAAVSKAIEDEGCKTVYVGLVPSPVLANYGIREGIPSVMVTGSHIPDDRNGIKFTKKSGEVLKTDESDILRNVATAREDVYAESDSASIFDDEGMFRTKPVLPGLVMEAEKEYIERYLTVFPKNALEGKKICLYQHSAVGRDIVKAIFEGLGAEVVVVGRSETFIPVDTEKISDQTGEVLKKAAEEHKPFAIISTDGDSDRPLFADENGNFLPGDKLGALVSIYLTPDFAAIPVSANPAVIKGLESAEIEVEQTKIGSPYVIAAMNDKISKDSAVKVVSWESNGGFLLGSDWELFGKTLKALPTRDAVLPLLSAILLASDEGLSVSSMIEKKLPPFYTAAGVVDNKDRGAEDYTSDMGRKIVSMFSPKDSSIKSVVYKIYEGCVSVLKVDGADLTPSLTEELLGIRTHIEKYFSHDKGFGDIVSVNFLDGIRIIFRTGDGKEEVSHIRPSGNAPEFRNYAAADTAERAEEIAGLRYEIVPEMVKDLR